MYQTITSIARSSLLEDTAFEDTEGRTAIELLAEMRIAASQGKPTKLYETQITVLAKNFESEEAADVLEFLQSNTITGYNSRRLIEQMEEIVG